MEVRVTKCKPWEFQMGILGTHMKKAPEGIYRNVKFPYLFIIIFTLDEQRAMLALDSSAGILDVADYATYLKDYSFVREESLRLVIGLE